MKTKRIKELRKKLDNLPCPYCPFKGDLLSLLGHALRKHKINIVARLSKGRRKKDKRRTTLRFIKARAKRKR